MYTTITYIDLTDARNGFPGSNMKLGNSIVSCEEAFSELGKASSYICRSHPLNYWRDVTSCTT